MLAIDGNKSTAWGIYPQVGKPHEAVFELAEPIVCDAEMEIMRSLAAECNSTAAGTSSAASGSP